MLQRLNVAYQTSMKAFSWSSSIAGFLANPGKVGMGLWLIMDRGKLSNATVLTAIACGVLWSGFEVTRLLERRVPWDEQIPELDSFSEPAIAAAVLRHHAEELRFADGLSADSEVGAGRDQVGSSKSKRLLDSPARRLESLRAEIAALNADITAELMVTYLARGSICEFLDCYIQLAMTAPESIHAKRWERHALQCANQCGRRTEVTAVIRYASEARGKSGLSTPFAKAGE